MDGLTAVGDHAAMAKKVVSRLKQEGPRHFIREWRNYRQLTQEQLAARIERSTSTISQLETGEQGYREETLLALADALNCGPGDLLMRNPMDTEAPWSIWEKLKPNQRKDVIALMKSMAGEAAAA